MTIEIILFGSLVGVTGKSTLMVSDCADTDSLKEKVLSDFPKLKDCTFLISVDKKIIKCNQKITSGNEIAFLPPFAGG